MSIMVVAIKPGYYKKTYRYVNDRFTLEDEEHFSSFWMVKLTDEEKKKIQAGISRENKAKEEAINKRVAESNHRSNMRKLNREAAQQRAKDIAKKKDDAQADKTAAAINKLLGNKSDKEPDKEPEPGNNSK